LKKEHRLKLFEKRVLSQIFGPKRGGEVTEEWKRLHGEKLDDSYSSPEIIPMMKSRIMQLRGMWHLWRRGEERSIKGFVGKT
jgi:hypothetical protein